MKTTPSITQRALVLAIRAVLVSMALAATAQAVDAGVAAATPAVAATAAADATDVSSDDDNAVTALTRPTSSIELGIGEVDHASAKFGEYNGQENRGPYSIGNIDLRGGGDNDQGSTLRYRLRGSDLGLSSRSVNAEVGQQGEYRFNLGYDALQRNRSDSYQTPYQGIGTSNLTLPSSWQVPIVPVLGAGFNARGLSPAVTSAPALVSGVVRTPSVANLSTAATVQGTDLPMFRNVDLYTKRAAESAAFSTVLTSQWDLTGSIRHEKKDGYKPMGALSILAPTNNEISTVIPDLIRQTHNQYNLALSYHDSKDTLSAAYYGSTFENDVTGMSWTDWSAPLATRGSSTIGSPPSNQFHQLSLTGTHNWSSATRLTANIAYGRNAQDVVFTPDSTDILPAGVSSLHGEVISKALNFKLTSKWSKDWTLAAGYKFDERDNRTPVNTYQFSDAQQTVRPPTGNPFPGVVLAQNANANRPYSKRLNQINLDADYRFAGGQALKGGLDWQKIDRWCNGSWIDCADAATTKESTLRLEWRSSLLDDVNGRVGYAHGVRRVSNYNENAFLALVPFANVVPVGATVSAYQYLQQTGLTGYGPIAGYAVNTGNAGVFFPGNNALANADYANQNRISELPGMRRYNMADRNRDKLRTAVNWQATEKLSWQGGFDYNQDDYFNTTYGLKAGSGWALNLDGTYAASDTFTASVYFSREEQRQETAGNSYTANSAATSVAGFTAISGGCFATIATRNANNKIDPCLNWTGDMRDSLDTVGLSFQQKGLLKDKLTLAGDLSFSRARTYNDQYGGNYVNNPLAVTGAPAGTVAAFFIPATSLPTISTNTLQLRLNGQYTLDRASALRGGIGYARMTSNDYMYDGMQPGGLTAVLPSMELAPTYTVHTYAVSYIHSFQ